jgi:primosomal protein N' (replication factor Y)
LLTQVAGRAGRGELAGQAIVQTLYPRHYSVVHACRQDYTAFFDQEIEFRNAMRYPPVVALINIVIRGRSQEAAMADGTELAHLLREAPTSFRVLGPAPAPLVKLKGEHRVQLLLKGARRTEMRKALQAVLKGMSDRRTRIAIDIDPLSVL